MLVRWAPFREFSELQNDMNRMFDQYVRRANPGAGSETSAVWAPAVDVYEDEGSFVIHAELPGLGKEDIELHLENRTLTIRGERKLEKGLRLEGFHQRERLYGRFARSFTLPASIDQEKISASFKDGVLSVVLPKAEEVKPKLIQVQAD
jgi:HSP20 family protein